MNLSLFNLTLEPFDNFQSWYLEAKNKEENADAFVLSTANLEGEPSARYLLHKGIHDKKFCFYSNYNSRKAKDIFENPRACMSFFWHRSGRQVRVSGNVEKMEEKLSREYFYSRSFESQLASALSNQSAPMSSKEEFMKDFNHKKELFKNKGKIEYPKNWGGFYLVPNKFEFFIYGEHRINDRIEFLRAENESWRVQLLYP